MGNDDIHKYDIGAEGDNGDGYDLLNCALMGRKYDTAVYLIEKGADVNAQDCHGWSVLQHIVNKPIEPLSVPITKMLLERGADPNIPNDKGTTALMVACTSDLSMNYELAELLLEYGGDVNITNYAGNSPLSFAYKVGHKKLIQMLEEHNK